VPTAARHCVLQLTSHRLEFRDVVAGMCMRTVTPDLRAVAAQGCKRPALHLKGLVIPALTGCCSNRDDAFAFQPCIVKNAWPNHNKDARIDLHLLKARSHQLQKLGKGSKPEGLGIIMSQPIMSTTNESSRAVATVASQKSYMRSNHGSA
jgi:hypothetical protein